MYSYVLHFMVLLVDTQMRSVQSAKGTWNACIIKREWVHACIYKEMNPAAGQQLVVTYSDLGYLMT